MFTLFYCDYYILFFITLIFFVNLLKNKIYLLNNSISINNLFINASKLMALFLIINILNLNFQLENFFFSLNFLVIYKFFIALMLLIFLIFLNQISIFLKLYNFEYFFVFMFTFFSLFVLLQSNNFFNFYIILESYSLSICSVLALKKLNKNLVDSTFKYLIFNIISSCVILFGISHIYAATGLLNFFDINQALIFFHLFNFKNVLWYGYFLLMLGFSMKLAVFPFSLLLNQIYSNLSNVFLFFLLIIPKFCFTIFLYNNTLFYLNYSDFKLIHIFFYFFIVTSVLHAILSTYSLNLKKLIINTSFSNLPFLLLPIYCKSIFLLSNLFNFIFLYFLNLFCFFTIFVLFCISRGVILKKITNLVSLFYSNKSLTFLILINLLSLASLPPFFGFFAKLYYFYFLLENKMFVFYFLLSFINLIIVYVYLRLLRLLFLYKKNVFLKNINIKKSFISFLIVMISFLNTFYIFFFDFFYSFFFILLNSNVLF